MKLIFRILNFVLNISSFEFLLTILKWPNGGTVIFIRTILVAIVAFATYILIIQGLDPSRLYEFSSFELKKQIVSSLEIFGALFAGIYIALYSRFSAQWSYLANLYNQIKQTEASNGNPIIINELKAAFLEDANELHLARKPMFAMIIKEWMKIPEVEKLFKNHVRNGTEEFDNLKSDIDKIA